MNPLDSRTLKSLVENPGQRLEGDWVVIGGNVLPLLGVEHRTTRDPDGPIAVSASWRHPSRSG